MAKIRKLRPESIEDLDNKSIMIEDESPSNFRPERPQKPEKVRLGYLKVPIYVLSPNNVQKWRLMNKSCRISEEQTEILKCNWNHLCAGTKSPIPNRRIEKVFVRLNKILEGKMEIYRKTRIYSTEVPERIKAQEECDISRFEKKDMFGATFYEKSYIQDICPDGHQVNKSIPGNKLGRHKQLLSLFVKKDEVDLLSTKIDIRSRYYGSNTLEIHDAIPRDVASSLFGEGLIGFLRGKEAQVSLDWLTGFAEYREFCDSD